MVVQEPNINQRIWQVVAAIPVGSVSTYGEVATRAGLPGAARRVGAALRNLPNETRIPWHRVINASGRVSLPVGSASHKLQRERLRFEGVVFKRNGAIDLKKFRW
ncbi:MAG: methylated-DNA-protein-cysteine methyltransferase-like protein [Bacteroidia bacterium]|jgi:methylated-DNA-protein-cysteine methyltransferase-like protein